MIRPPVVPKTDHLYLYPCTLFAAKETCLIKTILGSCVSVCFYDPILKIGGMNHFMLPVWNGDGLESPKYGNIAIQMLLEKMLALGSQKRNIVAKIFGGANQYDYQNKIICVGERNCQLALCAMEKYGITITASSLRGVHGRKIVFNTATGEVLMKYITQGIFSHERKQLD
jgi:chemotaxis protein CheD